MGTKNKWQMVFSCEPFNQSRRYEYQLRHLSFRSARSLHCVNLPRLQTFTSHQEATVDVKLEIEQFTELHNFIPIFHTQYGVGLPNPSDTVYRSQYTADTTNGVALSNAQAMNFPTKNGNRTKTRYI